MCWKKQKVEGGVKEVGEGEEERRKGRRRREEQRGERGGRGRRQQMRKSGRRPATGFAVEVGSQHLRDVGSLYTSRQVTPLSAWEEHSFGDILCQILTC